MVGMAEIHVSTGPAQFTCLGLGSCIGLALLDPQAKVTGMIHIMLPAAFPDRPVDKVGKFADTGITELIDRLKKIGAVPSRLIAAYCGGAQVFQMGNGESKMDIGIRNAAAVQEILKKLNIKVVAQDVGGNSGRTMIYDSESGNITVRTVLGGERVLCTLKAS